MKRDYLLIVSFLDHLVHLRHLLRHVYFSDAEAALDLVCDVFSDVRQTRVGRGWQLRCGVALEQVEQRDEEVLAHFFEARPAERCLSSSRRVFLLRRVVSDFKSE